MTAAQPPGPVPGARRRRVYRGNRNHRIATAVTDDQFAIITRRADAAGLTVASWLYQEIEAITDGKVNDSA